MVKITILSPQELMNFGYKQQEDVVVKKTSPNDHVVHGYHVFTKKEGLGARLKAIGIIILKVITFGKIFTSTDFSDQCNILIKGKLVRLKETQASIFAVRKLNYDNIPKELTSLFENFNDLPECLEEHEKKCVGITGYIDGFLPEHFPVNQAIMKGIAPDRRPFIAALVARRSDPDKKEVMVFFQRSAGFTNDWRCVGPGPIIELFFLSDDQEVKLTAKERIEKSNLETLKKMKDIFDDKDQEFKLAPRSSTT